MGLDFNDTVISSAVETLLRSQLDKVETLDVAIQTDPFKLTQGQLDSLHISGKGIVIQNDLRTDSLQLATGPVDISMTQIALGEFSLDEAATATVSVSLTPEDIQSAFNSDYVKRKMRGQKVELLSGETITTDASNVEFSIPTTGRIAVSADVMLIEKVETHRISFSAQPTLKSGGHSITLEDVQYDEQTNSKPELTQSLIDATEDLLDLRTFDLGDISMQVTRLSVVPEQLLIEANADIRSFG